MTGCTCAGTRRCARSTWLRAPPARLEPCEVCRRPRLRAVRGTERQPRELRHGLVQPIQRLPIRRRHVLPHGRDGIDHGVLHAAFPLQQNERGE